MVDNSYWLTSVALIAILYLYVEVESKSLAEDLVTCGSQTCGAGAHCVDENNDSVCSCMFGSLGDPLTQCTRTECDNNSDCPTDQSCNAMVCVDVCDNACGANTDCNAVNHAADCICKPGYTGNPYDSCSAIAMSRQLDKNS